MDNEYGVSPWMVIRMMGPLMVIGPFVLAMIVTAPLVLYVVARWRAGRERAVDTQLGIKFALSYFGMIAFQALLLGALVVLWVILSKMPGEDKGSGYRFGFGFIVPALIVFSTHVSLLRRTNQDLFPNVRRLFLGYNLVIVGLVGFAFLVLAFQALFSKGTSGDDGRLFAAGVIVYGGAWAACGVQFGRLVLGEYSLPPDEIVPPSPPSPGAPGPQGPTLPPLGGGAYPPIDTK